MSFVRIYLSEELFKVAHKHLSLLLDELLTAELQVSVHVLLRVNVVLLYLWCSLGTTDKRALLIQIVQSDWHVFIYFFK